jgi:hypothetical protein
MGLWGVDRAGGGGRWGRSHCGSEQEAQSLNQLLWSLALDFYWLQLSNITIGIYIFHLISSSSYGY